MNKVKPTIKIKKRINKKGQFYMITALILCLVTFAAIKSAQKTNIVSSDTFETHVNHLMIESPKVINYALYRNHDVNASFQRFETEYLNYLNAINIELGLIYLINTNNQVMIKNSYNGTVTTNSQTIGYKQYIWVDEPNKQIVTVDGIDYNFNFTDEPVELKMLFIKK